MMPPIRILFVCHGNICRSPMAQCVMQNLVNERNLTNQFVIDSAATTTEELGNPMYPPARRELERHGVPVVAHRARQITRQDGDTWDYIVFMDAENERHLRRILGAHPRAQVLPLMSFAGSTRDVADPWYTGDFASTYQDVLAGCTAFLDQLAG